MWYNTVHTAYREYYFEEKKKVSELSCWLVNTVGKPEKLEDCEPAAHFYNHKVMIDNVSLVNLDWRKK